MRFFLGAKPFLFFLKRNSEIEIGRSRRNPEQERRRESCGNFFRVLSIVTILGHDAAEKTAGSWVPSDTLGTRKWATYTLNQSEAHILILWASGQSRARTR